jgi:hypothetical protein
MPDENVQIYHPDIPHTTEAPVTRSRRWYDGRGFDKGWRLWPPKTDKKESK